MPLDGRLRERLVTLQQAALDHFDSNEIEPVRFDDLVMKVGGECIIIECRTADEPIYRIRWPDGTVGRLYIDGRPEHLDSTALRTAFWTVAPEDYGWGVTVEGWCEALERVCDLWRWARRPRKPGE